jgi:ABC-2 type transport system permease protein
VEDNKTLSDIVAAQGNGTLLEQYMAMSFRILALVAAGFAIQSALRIRSEEASGRAEPVLATPVSRLRFASSHLAIAFGGTLAIMIVLGVTFGVADAAVTGDTGAIGQAVVAALLFVPAVWLLVGFTTTLIGLFPRATAVAWAVLGGCFVIGMFGQLLDLAAWVQDISPFQHVPPYPAGDVEVLPLAALLATAALLTAIGVVGLQRRDVG